MKFPRPRAFRRRHHHPLSWGRRARLLLLDLLGREETPERVAAALAVGVGVGFSPFIGVHIWLALALAFIFRLNKIDTVLGQFSGNPWTLPPSFAAGYHLGRFVLGYDETEVPELPWSKLLHRDFWQSFAGEGLRPRLASFLLGNMVIAVLAALATYFLVRFLLRLYHRRHPRVARRAARRREDRHRKREASKAT
ncbi:MAG: DUF2062 domain-containing protein [Thermoanaerobaculia bacterium]